MLRKHKNYLLETLQKRGEDISKFQASEESGSFPDEKSLFVITLKNTPLRFIVKPTGNTFTNFLVDLSSYSPDYPLIQSEKFIKEYYQQYGSLAVQFFSLIIDDSVRKDRLPINIEEVSTILIRWLKAVVHPYLEDNSLPDLWSQTEFSSTFANTMPISEEDCEPFTEDEKSKIREGIKEFRRLIVKNYNPAENQLHFINKRLDYLIDATERLNRFDWKGLTLSIISSIAINLTVDTEGGRTLFRLFQHALEIVKFMLK